MVARVIYTEHTHVVRQFRHNVFDKQISVLTTLWARQPVNQLVNRHVKKMFIRQERVQKIEQNWVVE